MKGLIGKKITCTSRILTDRDRQIDKGDTFTIYDKVNDEKKSRYILLSEEIGDFVSISYTDLEQSFKII